MYEISGIYPGPDFFRIETAVNGASLRVDRDLTTDSLASPSYLVGIICKLFKCNNWLRIGFGINKICWLENFK